MFWNKKKIKQLENELSRTRTELEAEIIANEQLNKLIKQKQSELVKLRKQTGNVGHPWKFHFEKVFSFADWLSSNTENEMYDVCLVHDSLGLEAAYSIHLRTKCKLIYDAVEYPEYTGRSSQTAAAYKRSKRGLNLVQNHESRIIQLMDCIIVGTRGVAEWYNSREEFPKATIVRNCLDFIELEPERGIREDCGITDDDILVLYPNSIHLDCGIDEVIDSLSLLPDKVHLAIMGNIPEFLRKPLLKKISAKKLNERVHILPLRRPADLLEYRSGADISIIPLRPNNSNHKTCLPNRIFEMIMSRLPMVISDLTYVREVVEEYNCGSVFLENRPKLIAGKITEVINNLPYYKERIDYTASQLCWKYEQKAFLDAINNVIPDNPAKPLSILAIANKPVTTNRRFYRHTRTIADMGHNVSVRVLENPFPELMDERIDYRGMRDEESDSNDEAHPAPLGVSDSLKQA